MVLLFGACSYTHISTSPGQVELTRATLFTTQTIGHVSATLGPDKSLIIDALTSDQTKAAAALATAATTR